MNSHPAAAQKASGSRRTPIRALWIVPLSYLYVAALIAGYLLLTFASWYWVEGDRILSPTFVQPLLLFLLIPAGILLIGAISYSIRTVRARREAPPAERAPLDAYETRSVVKVSGQRWFTRPVVWLQIALPIFALVVGPGLYLYNHPTATQPSSWAVQFAFAQQTADHIETGAVLEEILAEPIPDLPAHIDANTTFQIAFVFIRPSGTTMRITIADTAPPRLLATQDVWDTVDPPPTPEQLQRYAHTVALIKLSPRDVYRQTLAEGLAFGQGKGLVRPSLSLFMDHDWQAQWGVPTGWSMTYSANYQSVTLRVNPTTGQVLARESP
jgi:hypothetical protein